MPTYQVTWEADPVTALSPEDATRQAFEAYQADPTYGRMVITPYDATDLTVGTTVVHPLRLIPRYRRRLWLSAVAAATAVGFLSGCGLEDQLFS